MIRALLRRVCLLERQGQETDWRAYVGLPVEEWPDWALDAGLAYPSEDALGPIAKVAGSAQ